MSYERRVRFVGMPDSVKSIARRVQLKTAFRYAVAEKNYFFGEFKSISFLRKLVIALEKLGADFFSQSFVIDFFDKLACAETF